MRARRSITATIAATVIITIIVTAGGVTAIAFAGGGNRAQPRGDLPHAF